MTTTAEKKSTPTRRRRWPIVLAVLLVPLFVAYLFVCDYLERKLERAVAEKLDAELRIDGLLYVPPYGIRLTGAQLVRKNNVILNLGWVSLKLAESPFGDAPVLIENVDVRDPVVRIIRTAEGLQGGPGFVKEDVKREPEPKKKFSDLLRLRKLRITNGQIVYDDDTSRYARDVVWRDINVELRTAQKGPALYTYELTFGNAPVVDASAAGSIDVDALVLALDNLHLGARVDPGREESPLPGEVQSILKDYAVAGRLGINGKGVFPFRNLGESKYEAALELSDGKLRVPQWKAHFDDASVKLRLAASRTGNAATTRPAVPALNVAVDSVQVTSGGASLRLTGGALAIDPGSRTWALRELVGKLDASQGVAPAQASAIRDAIEKYKIAGAVDFTAAADGPLKPDANRRLDESIRHEVLLYPRGLAFQPKNFPEPLREVGGGVIRVSGGEAIAENLSARYGNDRWLLDAARVPLAGIKQRIQVNQIEGLFDFHPPSPQYPKALRATVRALAPAGESPVSGSFDIHPKAEPGTRVKYDLVASSDTGAFAVTNKRIPITNIRGVASVKRDTVGTVQIRTFDGDSLGGRISARATFVTTKPRTWSGTASLRELNLEELARFYEMPEKEKHKLVGRAFANVELSGQTQRETAVESLRGKGRLEVFDGDFFQLPVLGLVTKTVAGDGRRDLGTVGEAAGLFAIEGRTIRIREAAISAPLLGVQGDGEIGLDGKLDLNLVAAPLADWRDRLKQTKIPVVSDVTGEVAGAIQRTLNAATRGLLYKFRVTGDLKRPDVKTIPAPALNEAQAILFGHMLGKPKGKRLIDLLRDDDEK